MKRIVLRGLAPAARLGSASTNVRPSHMRRYDNFSDHDFEVFVADLLGAELGVNFETFLRGADRGVDLRGYRGRSKRPDVVQCKHYEGSTFGTLLRAAKTEAERLTDLTPRPRSYRFVTSQRLTALRKETLAAALSPWIPRDDYVLGAHDLDLLLDRHPDVERRQVKLWLTGGTQLAALLRSGTLTRSRDLLAEIQRAMPRYVPGAVFTDARHRLREEHVLVIAGVPGIGKTTLARMLLADAVLDGYEPIEVSHDIEEAYELVDDRVKQVFLYDDFLGRTALHERFAKNEDRRLIDFMHRAAMRRSTLFVLTTREYILRQAAQLYERLEQEGVEGRRFLLTLGGYSRLDRARIFANHVYHSEQLDSRVKRALMVGQAYEAIIDHGNYNPRTIEWITGLAGHKLADDQLTDYVSFAVDSLEHPERIWQHAFEREIDDHGRALLFAVGSLQGNIELRHLEAAFDALCRARDLSLAGRAFERTLQALNDSFVRTYHDDERVWRDRGILVRPYDPSVIDFLYGYLRRSPGDVVYIARSAPFFEQIEWLAPRSPQDGGQAREDVAEAIADGIARTFEAPPVRPLRMPLASNSWIELSSDLADLEGRLLFVLELMAEDDMWRERLDSWWQEAFASTVDRWREGTGHPPSLLALLRRLAETDMDLTEPARAARTALRGQRVWMVTECEWMIELRGLAPDAFSREEWAALVDEFAGWAGDLRTFVEDMSEEAELEAVERVAEELGVTLDEDELRDAEDILRENIQQRESEIDPDEHWDDQRGRVHDEAAESREVDAIFARLADSDT